MTIQKPGILRKLSVPWLSPCKVLKHHANGDIAYEKAPNVNNKVNIRRVYPYYKKDSDEYSQQHTNRQDYGMTKNKTLIIINFFESICQRQTQYQTRNQ